MQKAVWLSFDLGVKGDYESMYAWLDNHQATECGDSVAFFKYDVSSGSAEELLNRLTKDLKTNVQFGKSDRVYVAYRADEGTLKGRFILGKRRASPWHGYGDAATEEDV